MEKCVRVLEEEFNDYGYILEYNKENQESFQVVLTEKEKVGWRIAFSKITSRKVKEVARHPETMEVFEPVEGVTLLCVSHTRKPRDFQVYLLDRPVCIKKNIWHVTICLSDYSLVRIVENSRVNSEKFVIEETLDICI